MTDYGPGHGSPPRHPRPWHPDDPLWGDQGWESDPSQTGGWDPYAQDGQAYHSGQYPQAQPEQLHYDQQFPQQYAPQDYSQQQQFPQAPHDQQQTQQWDTGQLPTDGYGQTYGWEVQPQAPYLDHGYNTQGYGNDAYGNDLYGGDPYGTGEFPAAGDPYGAQPPGGYYDQHGYPQQHTGQIPTQQAPQQQAPQQQIPQQQVPEQPAPSTPPPQRRPPAAEQTGEWNPFEEEEEPETHPFFTRGSDADDSDEEYERRRPRDDDDDDDYDVPGSGRKGKNGKRGETKRRGGCACLAAVVALGGLVSGGGYAGYRYYENHYAPPPDYAGQGSGTVQVQIPDSSTLAQIGNILKTNGVVESVDAFTKAAAGNPKGSSIQGGIYTLRKEMSATSAVLLLLDPASQSSLTVPEGWRATQVYAALDKRLGLAAGTTAGVAKKNKLGLPSYDKGGNPEGFLYPSRYSAAKGGDPAAILKQMVQRATAEYSADGLQAKAAKVGRTPYEIVVIASLIQAEAQEPQDFGRVSRVIYNRLAQNMALGFDSTINYAKGRSTLDTTTADTHFDSPYNTYLHKGLPPGPIDNPGHQAIEAALNPTPGDWLYFVTVKPGDTRFTASEAQHEKNVAAFNEYQREHGG
jgi:uncharacterized YceG family protein